MPPNPTEAVLATVADIKNTQRMMGRTIARIEKALYDESNGGESLLTRLTRVEEKIDGIQKGADRSWKIVAVFTSCVGVCIAAGALIVAALK